MNIVYKVAIIVLYACSVGTAFASNTVADADMQTELAIQDWDIVIGQNIDHSAQTKVIEYADFTCTHCIDTFKQYFPRIVNSTKKDKPIFVFRPLVLTKSSLKAAAFLMCKKRAQSENVKILNVLFDGIWHRSSDYIRALENNLKNAEVDVSDFYKCINSSPVIKQVMQVRTRAAKKLNIPGTPYVFINNDVSTIEKAIKLF